MHEVQTGTGLGPNRAAITSYEANTFSGEVPDAQGLEDVGGFRKLSVELDIVSPPEHQSQSARPQKAGATSVNAQRDVGEPQHRHPALNLESECWTRKPALTPRAWLSD